MKPQEGFELSHILNNEAVIAENAGDFVTAIDKYRQIIAVVESVIDTATFIRRKSDAQYASLLREFETSAKSRLLYFQAQADEFTYRMPDPETSSLSRIQLPPTPSNDLPEILSDSPTRSQHTGLANRTFRGPDAVKRKSEKKQRTQGSRHPWNDSRTASTKGGEVASFSAAFTAWNINLNESQDPSAGKVRMTQRFSQKEQSHPLVSLESRNGSRTSLPETTNLDSPGHRTGNTTPNSRSSENPWKSSNDPEQLVNSSPLMISSDLASQTASQAYFENAVTSPPIARKSAPIRPPPPVPPHRSSQAQIVKTKPSKPSPSGVSRKSKTQQSNSISNKSDATSDLSREEAALKNIKGIDEELARTILNDILVRGEEIKWDDIAGLESSKTALKETVVYPFLRPDLFNGLREPAAGMLLFGPPGTGKTMLARAVATQAKSTFFQISASSLTSKYVGDSEKLVKALFLVARELSPSIIFVDEIDSILSSRRGGGNEHEASRRLKTEFLVQWSNLSSVVAHSSTETSRVLVLAATNLPWDIDDAAIRRFVRRQYIPLPEAQTREQQIRRLISRIPHNLFETDLSELVKLTEGYSGSDIHALARDAAMGPIRSLGDALLTTPTDQIRVVNFSDFVASTKTIRASVRKEALVQFERWNHDYGSG
ncbi:putative AAA domain-containing protein [Neolecta irregularis DAH-3]|uniref:Putative AAA domain-containing protein n=1 Tax=Neolecta irregularis (strain DAH-3) TaxID=1198029 RepID=A0A1U7LIL4_NEOID|nr:putative AAA domain-containing protein [Neolecta irregularis DAH-3]|eukprot:OLL22495.1 putative AAA domain-containing protein [Neolecta irregularis DAH-3]